MPKRPPKNAQNIHRLMRELGFTETFTAGIVSMLDTDFVADRLYGYLRNARPRSETAVADEVVAVFTDREKYRQKHIDDAIIARRTIVDSRR
ncbi:MAG: hypothetical protein Q4C53_05560 [Clostridia bacterium]|nr:hypothetical protein [Clostridia bacterium]